MRKQNTINNKVVAILFLLLGLIIMFVTGDATALVLFTFLFVIPLWFAKRNYIS